MKNTFGTQTGPKSLEISLYHKRIPNFYNSDTLKINTNLAFAISSMLKYQWKIEEVPFPDA